MPYFVYILECSNNALYTGITTDLERRLKQHQERKGGHYTSYNRGVIIRYQETQPTRSAAAKREAEIKGWSRTRKLGLIKGEKEKLSANDVIKELKSKGSSTRAKSSAWFFKTGKGQYGYGDLFLGVTVPEQRKTAKRFSQLDLKEIGKLLRSKYHECRLTGLFILVQQYKKGDKDLRGRIVRFYLANSHRINNWDLVDSSASYILGDYLLINDRKILYKLARSANLWERRIAIISTAAFIRQDQFADTLKIAKMLLNDDHDLIHKAVGWMLREVGKRARDVEEKFLEKYAATMPRTMLRYAIEKFSPARRLALLKRRSSRPVL